MTNKRYREGLLGHADDARQSRELARIRTDVPVEFDPEALRYRGASRERCFELFSRLGFRSLVMEYAPTADTVGKDYARRRRRPRRWTRWSRALRTAGRFGFRVLPDGPAAMRAAIVGLAFSTSPRHAPTTCPSPADHGGGLFGDAGERPAWPAARRCCSAVEPLLEDAAIAKVGHDLKFDAIVLARHGVALRGLELDTMLASYLLDATRSAHPLEELALEHTGYKALSEEDVCGRGAKALSLARLPVDAALDYAGERADLALQLAGDAARAAAPRSSSTSVYRDARAAADSGARRRSSAPASASTAPALARAVAARRARARRAERARSTSWPARSSTSTRRSSSSEILFDKLQLPVLKRTGKTQDARRRRSKCSRSWRSTHELPRLILEWRALLKLKGTYIDALPQLVNPETGRVHTCFNQAVAATGRLSSSDPNLQNIPIRTELGREIRRAFVAEPGHVLISADYSQIELRVLAHLSGDEALIEAFRDGEDIHDRTALKVFGADSGLEPHELRATREDHQLRAALRKDRVHAGQGHRRHAAGGAGVHRRLLRRLPARSARFIDRTLDEARATGVVKTMFGRRRLVPELTSRNGQIRGARRARGGQHADPGHAPPTS